MFLHAFALLLSISSLVAVPAGLSRAGTAAVAADPAFLAMIGTAAPPDRVAYLSSLLRAASLPAGAAQAAADLPVFAVLRDVGAAGSPKYEASGIVLEVVTHDRPNLRLEKARLALMPAADGRSCRFEFSGSPFGQQALLEASGKVEWASGPAGGDGLEVEFRLDGLPVDSVRTWLPERVDPSFRGLLKASGKASGIVGETSNEEAPATPLRGSFEAGLDWQVLGRTAPVAIRAGFSLDDRMVRLRDGRMEWDGLGLDLRGWFQPREGGKYELLADFKDVDTRQVATDWGVAETWRPESSLSGTITLKGTPGNGLLNYDARASSIVLPALGGYTVRADAARLRGSLVAINADVAVSMRPERLQIGDLDLGPLPVGIRWWRDHLSVSTSNTSLWEGQNDTSLSYKPEAHPAFTVSGRLTNAKAATMATQVVPWLSLDVDGASSASYSVGHDASRQPFWSARASLVSGRLGGVDLFARTVEALAAADSSLALTEATALLPRPRSGAGTRVDRLFFQLERKGEEFEVGGLYLKAGDFQLDADGRFSRAAGMQLEGTMTLPATVADKLQASAPWIAALRAGGGPLHVGVMVGGQPSALSLSLSPGYADLLAAAKRGETVTAPGVREAKQVGDKNLATIPADPATVEY